MHPRLVSFIGALCALTLGTIASPRPAAACGGLFCDAQNPVNQTAERIIFVDGGDGTTTAVIQIMYAGPPDDFAWVLPVGDIPNPDEDIRVSSNLALDRLQQATNPQYTLQRRVEGECADGDQLAFPTSAGDSGGDGDSAPEDDGGGNVVVEASGSVGPFDFELISVRADDGDKVMVATDWLADNGYDLAGGEALLRPYLQSDMKLLCVRLSSGVESGSVRPLMVTYSGTQPSIPIRPTAVAAEDDMGIMAFVGGTARAIPKNYKLLELNEALIDWWNPNDTYNAVVIRAAEEASGHGFVTEYADESSTLSEVVVAQWERDDWQRFQSESFGSDLEMVERSYQYAGWDGFRDAFTAATSLPSGVSVQDVIDCPGCYLDGGNPEVRFDRAVFRVQLYELVIRPMFDTESLIAEQRWMTRMYTTMSAEDMTEDPVFDFNADMGAVSNQHTADLVIECAPELEMGDAPYRVELQSGVIVRGGEQNVWPLRVGDPSIPATVRIFEAGTSGDPSLLVDNVTVISQALDEAGTGGGNPDAGTGTGVGPGSGGDSNGDAAVCGCRTVGSAGPDGGGPSSLLGLGVLAGLLLRRRRRRA